MAVYIFYKHRVGDCTQKQSLDKVVFTDEPIGSFSPVQCDVSRGMVYVMFQPLIALHGISY